MHGRRGGGGGGGVFAWVCACTCVRVGAYRGIAGQGQRCATAVLSRSPQPKPRRIPCTTRARHRHVCDQVGALELEDTPYDPDADPEWRRTLSQVLLPQFTFETYTRCAQASMVTSEFVGRMWEWRRQKPDSARSMAAAAAAAVVGTNQAETEECSLGARVKRRKKHT